MLEIIQRFYNSIIAEGRYMLYLKGLCNTLTITIFALIIGIIIGFIVSIVRYSTKDKKGFRLLYYICQLYVTVIRGTPVMVQILIIYNVVFATPDINAIFSAILCFGINSGAYVAEIFRAGIESVDKGQMEAARSLGLTFSTSMISIIIPQAIKNILPTLGNEFISLLKETAIVGTISVFDLTRASQSIYSSTYDIMPPLVIITLIYLALVVGLSKLIHIFEKKLSYKYND